MPIAKTYDYIIVLKGDGNAVYYDWVSRLMIFIGIINLVYAAFGMTKTQDVYTASILCLAAIVSWIYAESKSGSYRLSLFFIFIALLIPLGKIFIAILYAIIGIMEKQVKFKRELGFDTEGITINTFPKKNYQWHEVSNVILKDGILTVDLYNNKIIQKELEDEPSDTLEKEFNEFCRSHLLSV